MRKQIQEFFAQHFGNRPAREVKQFLVIGLGRFGGAVATHLYEMGHEVVAIDNRADHVERLLNRVTHALIVNAADERGLRTLGVSEFDAVIVAIGADMQSNILATMNAKSLGAKLVISKAVDEKMGRVLEKIGADVVVTPENDMGIELARRIGAPQNQPFFVLDSQHSVIEMDSCGRLVGRLDELALGKKFGVQVLAIEQKGHLLVTPPADTEIGPNDKLVLLGHNHRLDDLRHHLDKLAKQSAEDGA